MSSPNKICVVRCPHFCHALLLLASHFVAHDWRFLSVCAPEASVGSSYRVHDGLSCVWQAVYVWPNRFVDLTPNVGLWWYLFTEVFDRFRPYVIVPVVFVCSGRP